MAARNAQQVSPAKAGGYGSLADEPSVTSAIVERNLRTMRVLLQERNERILKHTDAKGWLDRLEANEPGNVWRDEDGTCRVWLFGVPITCDVDGTVRTIDGDPPQPGKWTQQWMADRLGITKTDYGRLERRENANDSHGYQYTIDELVHLAMALDVSLASLLTPPQQETSANTVLRFRSKKSSDDGFRIPAQEFLLWVYGLLGGPALRGYQYQADPVPVFTARPALFRRDIMQKSLLERQILDQGEGSTWAERWLSVVAEIRYWAEMTLHEVRNPWPRNYEEFDDYCAQYAKQMTEDRRDKLSMEFKTYLHDKDFFLDGCLDPLVSKIDAAMSGKRPPRSDKAATKTAKGP